MKIIYIITYPPKYEYLKGPRPEHTWKNNKSEEIGVWRIDRGHVFARDVKKNFPEVNYEVWRPDYRAEMEYAHRFDDGVVHRSFPAQTVKMRIGFKRARLWTSEQLLHKMNEYIKIQDKQPDILFHIPVDFSYLGYVIQKRFGGKAPFLHTSHLNPHLLLPGLNTLNPAKFLHRLLMRRTYKKYMNFLSEIAVPGDRVNFFRQNTNANIHLLDFLNFDFEWTKSKISKSVARKKLKIESNKFIIFSSSRLVSEKQIDKMLKSFSSIKELDFLCIISGAGESEYEKYLKDLALKLSVNSKIFFAGFLSEKLMEYYCASDVFISTSGSESGPVSAIKAIALGIPVISTDTGIASYLLKNNNAGVILDRRKISKWGEKIGDVIKGKKINIIDPDVLKAKYDLKTSISELVTIYKKSIRNFSKT